MVGLRATQVQFVHGARVGTFHADIARICRVAGQHARFDTRDRRVGLAVRDIDRRAFHLGEAQAATHERRVAVGLQERRRLFLARRDLHPVRLAIDQDRV
jgi:hypothetical protein